MYQIFTGENWTALLYAVTSYDSGTSWFYAIFIILWFILSSVVILNMLISRIQENFDMEDKDKRLHQVNTFLSVKSQVDAHRDQHNLGNTENELAGDSGFLKQDTAFGNKLQVDAVVKDFVGETEDSEEPQSSPHLAATTKEIKPLSTFLSLLARLRPNFQTGEDTAPIQIANSHLERDQKRPHAIFRWASKIRRLCRRLTGQQPPVGASHNKPAMIFKGFIYITIVVKIVLACMTTPLYQRDYFDQHIYTVINWFVVTDLAILSILTVEAIIRIIAGGLIWGPDAYFRGWNLIDAVVLVTLAIQVTAELYNEGSVARVIACFKALRVLRLLTINKNVLKNFSSVFTRGGGDVFAATLVSLGLLIPFAIYGVNLFVGELSSCNDSNIWNLGDCFGEYNSSGGASSLNLYAPRTFATSYYSFDTFGKSFYALFSIVSQEGWADVMSWSRDITGRNTQPRPSASNGNAVFFVIFNLCGTFFVMTLFISIFIQNYTKITGVAYLTGNQRAWMKQKRMLQRISAWPSELNSGAPWRLWCYARATEKSGKWRQSIITILVLHLLFLCVNFYPSVDWWDKTRGTHKSTEMLKYRSLTKTDSISLVFITLLALNVVIRMIGLSWKHFRRRPWDLYALFSLSGALVASVLALTHPNNFAIIKTKELFQDAVCLLLIAEINHFDQLLKTAIASLPLISTLLMFWFVMLLFFAIALTQIFGLTRFGPNENGNANFRTIPKALILLFHMTLGEGRTQIMEDFAAIVPPFCVSNDSFFSTDCGSPELARIFFIAWKILSVYLFTNIFISLIYEGFSDVYQGLGNTTKVIERGDLRRLKDAWRAVDANGTGFIPVDSLHEVLKNLDGIFGILIYDGDFTIKKLLEDCVNPSPALPRESQGVDIDKLNDRLKSLPVDKIQQRRAALNRFHEEILLSSDPVLGISFTTFLLTLAHYTVIDDRECLTYVLLEGEFYER